MLNSFVDHANCVSTLFLAKVAMDVRLLSQTDACVTCPSNQARAAYYNDGLSAISLLSCQGPATTPREGVFSLLFFQWLFYATEVKADECSVVDG